MEKILDFRWITCCMVILALGLFIRPALAVDTSPGTFELDGNAEDDVPAAVAGDDWDTPPKPNGSATAFTGIVQDKNGLDNIFTGGGSKTPNLIEDWQWKTSPEPPDKNNITNAYAANYIVGGKQVVYFGADLFADNGDAELAFWFFQSEVKAVPEGATAGTFEGEHVDGDPYVAVKFANGGTEANIAVYEWWSDCNKNDRKPTVALSCAADNIRIRIPQAAALCDGTGGKLSCAITNAGPVNAPWGYTPKSGTPGVFPPTTFFEGGINIFDVFGENKCFSAFGVTTGASTSFTSTAKDFVLDDFDVCSVAATKTCVNDSEDDDLPTSITYNVRGCGWNDGGGSINITSLENTTATINSGNPYSPGDLAWYEPGQVDDGGLRDFDPATDCEDEGLLKQAVDNGSLVVDVTAFDLGSGAALVYQFSEETASNGPMDTVSISAEGTDGTPIEAATDTATCPLRTFNADLRVTKQCAADLEDVGSALQVLINVEGVVCNEGEVELTNLQLVDDPNMSTGVTVTLTPESTTLAPKGDTGECTTYTGSYTPDTIPGGDADTCPFADQVLATAIAPINSAGANCVLLSDLTSECSATSNTATCELRVVDGDNDCSTGPLSELP